MNDKDETTFQIDAEDSPDLFDMVEETYLKFSDGERFWGSYCNSKSKETLAEIVKENLSLVLDISFKCDTLFPRDVIYLINIIVGLIQQILREKFRISNAKKDLSAVVLIDKICKSENDEIDEIEELIDFKHLLRIHFPFVVSDREFFNDVIISCFNGSVVKNKEYFKNCGDFIDRDIKSLRIKANKIGDYVSLYNSSDPDTETELIYENFYSFISPTSCQEISFKPTLSSFKDLKLIPSNHSHVRNGFYDKEMLSDREPGDLKYLPFLLSINFCDKITEKVAKVCKTSKKETGIINEELNKKIIECNNEEYDESEILLKFFISLLKKERAEKEHFWLDVGRGIYGFVEKKIMRFNLNEQTGACITYEDGFKIWCDFTKKFSDVRDVSTCTKTLWDSFSGSMVSIKTIAFYASEDNINVYEKWKTGWVEKALDNAIFLDSSHEDVAKVIHRMYWLKFLCVGSHKGTPTWYFYENHGYNCIGKGLMLSVEMGKQLSKNVEKLKVKFREKVLSGSEAEKNTFNVGIMKADNLLKQMKNNGYKRNILSALVEFFDDPNFESIVDCNPNKFRTKNCILEKVGNYMIPRNGKPEDYICKGSKISYPFNFDEESIPVKKANKWIHQIFCEREVEEEFKKDCSSFLYARNSNKIFRVWSGEDGDNSKSMFVKALECIFGPRAIKMPLSAVSNSETGGPSPQMARAKNTNLVFIQEPETDTPLKEGIIKTLTGGDTVYCRTLFSEGEDMILSFNLVMIANIIPMIVGSGKAMRNRFRNWPFHSVWVDKPPETEEEQYEKRQFKKDPFFEEEIPEIARGLLWIFVQYFPKYMTEGLIIPETVRRVTEQYWENNDVYEVFINRHIVKMYSDDEQKIPNLEFAVTPSTLYKQFEIYFTTELPKVKVPTASVFRTEMQRRIGKLNSEKKWVGIDIQNIM